MGLGCWLLRGGAETEAPCLALRRRLRLGFNFDHNWLHRLSLLGLWWLCVAAKVSDWSLVDESAPVLEVTSVDTWCVDLDIFVNLHPFAVGSRSGFFFFLLSPHQGRVESLLHVSQVVHYSTKTLKIARHEVTLVHCLQVVLLVVEAPDGIRVDIDKVLELKDESKAIESCLDLLHLDETQRLHVLAPLSRSVGPCFAWVGTWLLLLAGSLLVVLPWWWYGVRVLELVGLLLLRRSSGVPEGAGKALRRVVGHASELLVPLLQRVESSHLQMFRLLRHQDVDVKVGSLLAGLHVVEIVGAHNSAVAPDLAEHVSPETVLELLALVQQRQVLVVHVQD